jgi:hypothetical protein
MPQQEQDESKDTKGTGPADVIAQLGEDVAQALRREIDDLRAEVGGRTATAAKGAGLLAGAGASASIACGALLTLPLMALRKLIPPPALALLVAAGAGSLGAVLARRGLRELEIAAPVSVEPVKRAARRALRSLP